MPTFVIYDNEHGAGPIDNEPREGQGMSMNPSTALLTAVLRDIAIVVAVVVYVIDTL